MRAATPTGRAGQARPWTERNKGSGSAPPAEINGRILSNYCKKKDYRQTQNSSSLSTT